MFRRCLVLVSAVLLLGAAHAQTTDGGVNLAKVKIPESLKSADLCPVHLVPSGDDIAEWHFMDIRYRGHEAGCEALFREDAETYAKKAARERWIENFTTAMSSVWCPLMVDTVTSGGRNKWLWRSLTWESCCQFCDEVEPDDGAFEFALGILRQRAAKSFELTRGRYVEGAKSPVEGAIVWPDLPPLDSSEAPVAEQENP